MWNTTIHPPSQLWSKMQGHSAAPRGLCTRPHGLLFAPLLTCAAQSEHRFFLPRSSVMMWRIVSWLICSCSFSRRTVNRRPCCSAACTAAMLSSVRLVRGCPAHSSSCMSSRPSQNLPNHRNVAACDKHSSPHAFRSNSYVSVPVLNAFQQNMIALRCSIFISMTIIVNTLRANFYNFTVTAATLLGFFSSFVRHPTTFFEW